MGECLSCGKYVEGTTCGKMTRWMIKTGSAHYAPCTDCFCETCITEPKNDAKWRRCFYKNNPHF